MVKRIASIVASSMAVSPVFAHTTSEVQANRESSTCLQDSRGMVRRNPFGLCWRSGTWSPADAVIGCDGELNASVANSTVHGPVAPATTQKAQALPASAPCDFKISLARDETSTSNKASLGKTAQKRIDGQIIRKVSGCAAIEQLVVSSHADGLGAHQYNQRLSEKRASAVASYLKSKESFRKIEMAEHGEMQSMAFRANKSPRRALTTAWHATVACPLKFKARQNDAGRTRIVNFSVNQ